MRTWMLTRRVPAFAASALVCAGIAQAGAEPQAGTPLNRTGTRLPASPVQTAPTLASPGGGIARGGGVPQPGVIDQQARINDYLERVRNYQQGLAPAPVQPEVPTIATSAAPTKSIVLPDVGVTQSFGLATSSGAEVGPWLRASVKSSQDLSEQSAKLKGVADRVGVGSGQSVQSVELRALTDTSYAEARATHTPAAGWMEARFNNGDIAFYRSSDPTEAHNLMCTLMHTPGHVALGSTEPKRTITVNEYARQLARGDDAFGFAGCDGPSARRNSPIADVVGTPTWPAEAASSADMSGGQPLASSTGRATSATSATRTLDDRAIEDIVGTLRLAASTPGAPASDRAQLGLALLATRSGRTEGLKRLGGAIREDPGLFGMDLESTFPRIDLAQKRALLGSMVESSILRAGASNDAEDWLASASLSAATGRSEAASRVLNRAMAAGCESSVIEACLAKLAVASQP